MSGGARPISITILAWVYLAVGVVGFVFHFRELRAGHSDAVGIELTECLAAVAGVFLLRGANWARWLALAWMVFHVVLSLFDNWQKLVVHGVFCAVIGWILFRPGAGRYFGRGQVEH